MTRRVFGSLMVGAVSGGWVVPAYLGLWFYIQGIEEAIGDDGLTNSFPFFHESHTMLYISAIWLFLVIIGWSSVIFYFLRSYSMKGFDRP